MSGPKVMAPGYERARAPRVIASWRASGNHRSARGRPHAVTLTSATTITYGADIPHEAELRLCGDVPGGGSSSSAAATTRTPSPGSAPRSWWSTTPRRRSRGARPAEAEEVSSSPRERPRRLAFASRGSVDLVFHREPRHVGDVSPFPPGPRVLKTGAPFVLPIPHPLTAALEGGEVVLRRPYGHTAPLTRDRLLHGPPAGELRGGHAPRTGAHRGDACRPPC